MQTIVIIGAGPTGLLLAHYLLARGQYRVEIYECRADPRRVDMSNGRTFPLSLQLRGMRALRTIPGLEAALTAKGIWSSGSVMHRPKGAPRQLDRKTSLLLIDRNQLTLVLLQHLLATYPSELITVHFNCACVGVHRESQTVTLQSETGEIFTTYYDRLVGADGARSQVRKAMEAEAEMHCQESFVPDAYKTLYFAHR